MACNLKNVLSSGNDCKENPAGLSNHVFVVPLDADHIHSIAVNDAKNQYVISPAGGSSGEPAALKGFRIDFKSQTGQVTSEDNGQGKGWTHTGTGRVELNEDDMALVSRTLHNSDKNLFFFPTGKVTDEGTEYKVIGNQFGEAEWGVAADSGTARGDDHGQTFTVTCAYQVYPVMKWYGTIQQDADQTFTDEAGDEVIISD